MSVLEMNRRLVLEKPARQDDGAGGFEQSVVTVRGAPTGSPARPVPQQRFRDGSRVFHIKSVAEQDAQGRYLICLAKEETAV